MLFARVALGLPVDGPFDYIVPLGLEKKIKVGSRVWVSFRTEKKLGYTVGLSRRTSVKKLKEISEVVDEYPLLDEAMLSLGREAADYYACSWGEVIDTMLPEDLREGKKVVYQEYPPALKPGKQGEALLIHDLGGEGRWKVYLEQISNTCGNNQSVIILLPDKNSVLNTKRFIASRFDYPAGVLYRKQPGESESWLKAKMGEIRILIGTRSAIFAPLKNLGLIIIDEEQDSVYKQDQVPHYHARQIGLMRMNREGLKLIFGSGSPSLESIYLARKKKINYLSIQRAKDYPEIKIIDSRIEKVGPRGKDSFLSRYLLDMISSSLNTGGKVLLFLNRKGFATYAYCQSCLAALRCPRCNINLVYHFEEGTLNCHYCNHKMQSPTICPNCNSGYIKFSGRGTQKLESELSRIFVQARIKRLDAQEKRGIDDADIFVATSTIIKQAGYPEPEPFPSASGAGGRVNFSLIGILDIDNSLNRIDFRSAEKTFYLLTGLLALSDKKIVIQTSLPRHNCLQALLKKDCDLFYNEELKQRRQLNFPPYRHLALVKLRSKKEEKVKQISDSLFMKLKQNNKNRDIHIISLYPGQPSKLRGNFCWQILASSGNPRKMSRFLKLQLKKFSRSGIIVTVDVDPL